MRPLAIPMVVAVLAAAALPAFAQSKKTPGVDKKRRADAEKPC